MAVALRAELINWVATLTLVIDKLRSDLEHPKFGLALPVMTPRLFPEMVPKLGLLEPDTIEDVLTAYKRVQELPRALLWKVGGEFGSQLQHALLRKVGGEFDSHSGLPFQMIEISSESRSVVIDTIEETISAVNTAIAKLSDDPALRTASPPAKRKKR